MDRRQCSDPDRALLRAHDSMLADTATEQGKPGLPLVIHSGGRDDAAPAVWRRG